MVRTNEQFYDMLWGRMLAYNIAQVTEDWQAFLMYMIGLRVC